MKNVGSIISGTGVITIVMDGKPYTIQPDNQHYQSIVDCLKAKTYSKLKTFLDIGTSLNKFTKGVAKVVDGEVLYNGVVVHNTLTQRIINLMYKGLPFEPMVKFFENVMQNPSETSRNELYGFLEASSLPITEDGMFLAYRKIRDDFKDFYTGTIDNSVGAKPKMERNLVDENRDRTCSNGLHFCSFSYLSQYHGGAGKVVVVKINPKNVVSIPSDYNNAKGRCCEYEVLSIVESGEKEDTIVGDLYTEQGVKVEGGNKFNYELVYAEGVKAYKNRSGERGVDANPYGDQEYDAQDAWTDGWYDTMALDDKNKPWVTEPVKTTPKYHSVRGSNGRFARKVDAKVKGKVKASKTKRNAAGRFC